MDKGQSNVEIGKKAEASFSDFDFQHTQAFGKINGSNVTLLLVPFFRCAFKKLSKETFNPHKN